MAEENAFRQKTIPVMPPAKQGILEQLNVSPAVIRFLRTNSKHLQIGIGAVLVVMLAYNLYGYYRENQREKSLLMLATAMEQSVKEERLKQLAGVVEQYGGSGAAVWAGVELGNNALAEGRYDDALKYYEGALDRLDSGNSLVPLLSYNTAAAFEGKGDLDKALAGYLRAEKFAGFREQGLIGQGRVLEKKGEGQKAAEIYRKARESSSLSAADKEWLDYRLAAIR